MIQQYIESVDVDDFNYLLVIRNSECVPCKKSIIGTLEKLGFRNSCEIKLLIIGKKLDSFSEKNNKLEYLKIVGQDLYSGID